MSVLPRFLIWASCTLVAGCVTQAVPPPTVTATAVTRPDGSIVQPVAASHNAEGRVVDLSRVQIDIPRGTEIGQIRTQYMTVCNGRWGSVVHDRMMYDEGRVSSRSVEWKDIFDRVMNGHGFRTAGAAGKLFAERDAEKPDYLAGMSITNLRIDGEVVCDFVDSRVLGIRGGAASITIDWQVFDPAQRRIVYQTKLEGRYSNNGMIPYDTMILVNMAYGDTVNKLAADPKLRDLVLQSRPQTASAAVLPPAGERLPLRRLPLSTQSIEARMEQVRGATVLIEIGDGGHGSGFIIADSGLILTNAHVVGGQRFVRVRLVSGRTVVGEVLRRHEDRDVALVKLEGSGYVALPLRETPVRLAEEVYVIGAPSLKELGWTVTRGVVSAYRQAMPPERLDFIQSDAGIHGGNSGGPMLDRNGNVIAICVAAIRPGRDKSVNEGLNLFIPILDGVDKLGLDLVDPGEFERRRRQVAVQ